MTADLEARVADLMAELRGYANPERAAYGKETYYPTTMEVLGVSVPELRRIARRLARELRDAPAGEVLAFAQALVDTRNLDARLAAYEFLPRQRNAFGELDTDRVEALGEGNDNWVTVDAFAINVAGPAWRAGLVSDRRVDRWAHSPDPWWRRTALATTVGLNRLTDGDTPRTLAVCATLVDDRHDAVVKALSWALRSLAARDPDAVRAFLERNDEDLAARVRREVRNKLETGHKNPPRGARRARGARS